MTNFYMYISASKMEASIWTALEGRWCPVLPEANTNTFLLEAERGEKRAYEYTKSRKRKVVKTARYGAYIGSVFLIL